MDFDQRQRGPGSRPQHTFERPGSDIKKSGYLKKFKTNKKKYFVLRSTSSSGPARLEYYDHEKKFKAPNGGLAKRSIQLHTCFNINRQAESRNCKNGIVLYTMEDSFIIVADSPEEQDAWLNGLLEYQYEYLPQGDEHREHYEHVWAVSLQPKGLGNKSNRGQYRVCLNNSSISFIKTSTAKPQFVIQLPTIRSIAQSECSFCMEVGKYAPTGEGKFWFHADDTDIVKDMHSTLHHYMNSTKDPSVKKDTSFRARSESHSSMSPNYRRSGKLDQRPASFYTSGSSNWRSSMDTTSPGSVSSSFGPSDHILGTHRPRSDTGDSRISRGSSHHEDGPHDFFPPSYKNGELNRELNIVPPDMSPPPSPKMFEEQLNAYLEMDASIHSNQSSGSNSLGGLHHHHSHHNPSVSSPGSSSYMAMSPHSQSSSVKGDLSPSLPDSSPSTGSSYMAMAQGMGGGSHFGSHTSAPIPIHSHVSSHPQHPTPLPTVREGGSNEGYLPMDITSSPSTPSNLRPEPVKCMLSLDSDPPNVGLPPRTYSLGSKPVGKKYPGYMDMGVGGGGAGGGSGGHRKGSLNNDNMLRTTSAPHIIHKGRRDRDRDPLHTSGCGTESPIPSPLSMSIKSDDSDSFMEYMPMRPRTASDSFNYRPRTSSQGKLQPMCRPRSSSHGQGTRPVTKFSSRIPQDSLQHRVTSRDSSLHDSFDSLRVSNESLRRMSQDLRHSPVVSVGEQHGEITMRVSTPPPPHSSSSGKNNNNNNKSNNNNNKELVDSYMAMDLASNLHHHPQHKSSSSSSSPHRMRTDSNSSGSHRPMDFLASPSQDSEYTEMAPIGHTSRSGSYSSGSKIVVGGEGGDDYMNMGLRRPTPSPGLSTSLQSPSVLTDSAYVNMDLDCAGASARRSDSVRSASVENVDSYILFDPAPLSSGSKLRTGSVGSKDKKGSLRVAASKKSGGAFSSHFHQQQHQPVNVSASTKKGGSSDSIRKPTRQSSMEKYGSLGKDFRKKSGSTGSRPMGGSKTASSSSGGGAGGGGDAHHSHVGFNLVPIRKPNMQTSLSSRNSSGVGGGGDGEEIPDDEYVEFSPNAYRDSSGNLSNSATSISSTKPPGIHIQSSSLSSPSPSSSFLSSAAATGSGASLSHPPHQQQASSNDDDYTPFAPANNIHPQVSMPNTKTTTNFQHHPQQQHHHHHHLPTRQQDDSDYTPFAPAGGATASTSQNKTTFSSNSNSSKHLQSSSTKKQLPPPDNSSDYIGYDPTLRPHPSSSLSHQSTPTPFSPPSLIPPTSTDLLSRQKNPKVQHHSSFDSPTRRDSSGGSSGVHSSTSLTFDPAHSKSTSSASSSSLSNIPRSGATMSTSLPSSSSSSSLPSSNPSSSSTSSSSTTVFTPSQSLFSYAAQQSKRRPEKATTEEDNSEYLSYNPAKPKTSSSESGLSPLKVTSLIRSDESSTDTPLTVDVSSSSSSLSNNESNSSNAAQPKVIQQQQHHQPAPSSPLSCITTAYLSSCNTLTTSSGNTNTNNKNNNSQTSPTCHSSPSPSPQPPSPLPTVSEDSLPWSSTVSTTRQKHASGSSTSSQKSRRISGDSSSENINTSSTKPLRKSSKSDSNSSLSSSSGSKNSNNGSGGGRRRVHSGDKTSQSGSAEKSPLLSPSSRSTEEFFCGLSSASSCSGKCLEAKMVPVESKIRHSVGDVTTMPGGSSGDGSHHQPTGMIRPGSTPCFQQMDSESSSGGSGSGSVFISPLGNENTGSGERLSSSSLTTGQPAASRSRHSMSDLGAYQQMTVGGGAGLNESGSGGSGDSYGSGGMLSSSLSPCPGSNPQKPLNYAQLDLSASGSGNSISSGSGGSSISGGGGGAGCEVKSRNLSDGDEKQPPLSYAKIDFVKSQNMNKVMGCGGDNNTSKT